ncbi:MAG: AgmX/PglI C-terminal domain-containing protein, partial [Myxococcota bacterium]
DELRGDLPAAEVGGPLQLPLVAVAEGGHLALDDDVDGCLVQGKMPTFRNCYQRELQRTPNLRGGQVTTQFIIGEDGFVSKARISKTTLKNDRVEQCLSQNLLGTPFPLPRNGTVVVSYPFTFNRNR